MFRLLLLAALVAVSAHLAVGKLSEDISTFYHTSEQLMQEYEALRANSCPLEISSRKQGNTELPFVRIASTNPSPPHRVLLFFGEHARELISTESGLALAKQLCSPDPDLKARVQDLLSQAEVHIFPNINVDGRKRVEQGEYCVRSNRRKVDLNRNWASHWEHASKSALASEMKQQSWGGSSAFSEDETQILRNEADQLRPTVFITVHSGILGLYMPYAYNGKLPSNARDSKSLMHILNRLNKQYCACQAGPAGKEVGYLCPGTCLDYMYDTLHTRYSFGFEIYDGETNGGFSNVKTATGDIANSSYANDKIEAQLGATSFLEVAFKNGMSPLNKRSEFWTTAEPHSEEYYRQMLEELDEDEEEEEMVLLQTAYTRGKRHEPALSPSSGLPSGGAFPQPSSDKRNKCLSSFNPVTKEAFDGTLHNWSRAFIDTVMLSLEDSKR